MVFPGKSQLLKVLLCRNLKFSEIIRDFVKFNPLLILDCTGFSSAKYLILTFSSW